MNKRINKIFVIIICILFTILGGVFRVKDYFESKEEKNTDLRIEKEVENGENDYN